MPINYQEYPPNWKEIRARILERDQNKCKFCDVPNNAFIYRPYKKRKEWRLMPDGHEADAMVFDGIKFTKIVLTIAHLDHDKLNHDVKDERLAALCQRCHLLYDLDRHISKRKNNVLKKLNQPELF
jgi:hypothetical protein